MKSALLVAGARALTDFPESVDWAEATLAGILASGEWTVVLTGGCPNSPYEWARTIAERIGLAWVEYRLDGKRYGSDGKTRRWWPPEGTIDHPFGDPHPHVRNQAMVDVLVKQKADGWLTEVVGFVAPWSSTRGTLVTIDKAKKAGLHGRMLTCPAFETRKPCVCGKGMFRIEGGFVCRGCKKEEPD